MSESETFGVTARSRSSEGNSVPVGPLLPVAPGDADFTLLLSKHIKAEALFTTYIANAFIKL